jgi:hypothetical protein
MPGAGPEDQWEHEGTGARSGFSSGHGAENASNAAVRKAAPSCGHFSKQISE